MPPLNRSQDGFTVLSICCFFVYTLDSFDISVETLCFVAVGFTFSYIMLYLFGGILLHFLV